MKPNSLTLRKQAEGSPLELWKLDGVGNCGKIEFKEVIVICRPLDKNPGFMINNSLGVHGLWGVEDAVNLVKAERAKLGLSTER